MTRIDQRFDAVEHRIEMLEQEMRAGFAEIHREFATTHRMMAQLGFGMGGLLIAQFVALVALK